MENHLWYENGKRRTSPEYRSWQAMRTRCNNPHSKDYARYGGRGICVDPRWSDFAAFLKDMGLRPTPAHTLDRENGDLNYTKSNCRWATRQEQARNRPYAATKAWLLAEQLGIKAMTAHHMIWQVRAKDRGDVKHWQLSPEREAEVRAFLEGN